MADERVAASCLPKTGGDAMGGIEAKAMAENTWNWEKRPQSRTGQGPSTALVTEAATIGASVVIKGDVSGNEPLFIEGTVEGSINFLEHRVTVGRSSRIRADIRASEVVVMGSVEGNIYCSDLLDVRADGSIKGHMMTERIRIDDGARLKGTVEVHPAKRSGQSEAIVHALAGSAKEATLSEDPADAFNESLLEAAAAGSVAGSQAVHRVPGSRTLIEPTR
jgi:cytoskeletal protein CcmA (bactofilin family)